MSKDIVSSGAASGTGADVALYKLPLDKPIAAKGSTIALLQFRKPITADVIEIGFPYLAVMRDGDTCIEFRSKVVARYISRLACIPVEIVSKLSIQDFQTCQTLIQGFFGRTEESSDEEEGAGISPGGDVQQPDAAACITQ
jgi:hypothetical protein